QVEQDQPDPSFSEHGQYLAAVAAGRDVADPRIGLQGQGQGTEPVRLIVHQQYAEIGVGRTVHRVFSSLQAGRVSVTIVPLPGVELNSRLPPCSLTIPAETDSPRPVPP